MKQITELTEKEILALTDEQLENMVQYKMAEEGIKILEYPQKPEFNKIPQKDESAFTIGGLTYPITNKRAAEEISAVISKNREYFSNTEYSPNDYSVKFLKPADDYLFEKVGSLAKEDFYSAETARQIADDKKANKEIEQAYQVELNEYNEAYERRKEIEVVIYGKFREVVDKFREMERLKAKYEQYLQLADGNEKTAMKFLKNAYNVSYEAEYFVKGEEAPVEINITLD